MLFVLFFYVMFTNFFIDAIYYTKAKSFRDINNALIGKRFALIMDVITIVLLFGVLAGFILISSKAFENFFLNVIKLKVSKYIMRPVLGIIIFPLTLLKDTNSLAKIGPVSFLVVMVSLLSIIGYFIKSYFTGNEICTPVDNSFKIVNQYIPFRKLDEIPLW